MEQSFIFSGEQSLEYLDHLKYNSFDATYFLHGICGVFALVLHDRFGYGLRVVLDDEWNNDPTTWESHIVHIYCTKNDETFIDVRGYIGDDYDPRMALHEFLGEFEDFIDFNVELDILSLEREDLASMLKKWMGEDYQSSIEAANWIIDQNPDRYTVSI